MIRYLFFPKETVELVIDSLYKYLRFICIDKILYIDFIVYLPEEVDVVWSQLSGPLVTINNPTSRTPSISFPIGFSSGEELILLKVESIDNPDIFLTIEIDTSLSSFHTLGGSSSLNNPYISSEYIPNILIPGYLGDPLVDHSIYFNPSIHNTLTTTYYPAPSYLPITKVEWYENIGGIYTLVAQPTSNFTHTVNRHVKAKYYFNVNGREEEVTTQILNDSLFSNPLLIGVSNLNINSNLDTSTVSINRASYLAFIINTIYDTLDTDILVETSDLNLEGSISSITRSPYLNYIATTNYLIEDSDIKEDTSLSLNSYITNSVTRNSYLFNASGISIG